MGMRVFLLDNVRSRKSQTLYQNVSLTATIIGCLSSAHIPVRLRKIFEWQSCVHVGGSHHSHCRNVNSPPPPTGIARKSLKSIFGVERSAREPTAEYFPITFAKLNESKSDDTAHHQPTDAKKSSGNIETNCTEPRKWILCKLYGAAPMANIRYEFGAVRMAIDATDASTRPGEPIKSIIKWFCVVFVPGAHRLRVNFGHCWRINIWAAQLTASTAN